MPAAVQGNQPTQSPLKCSSRLSRVFPFCHAGFWYGYNNTSALVEQELGLDPFTPFTSSSFWAPDGLQVGWAGVAVHGIRFGGDGGHLLVSVYGVGTAACSTQLHAPADRLIPDA
jgi:hypothetical protein